MAKVATITPLNQFFDTNGSPLTSGYLYFGLPNQDPEQFPAQMYWDAEGTIPALQPIRTISGYPSRAGSPAIIYGPDSYSLRVRSSALVQILYAPLLGGIAASASLSASNGSSLIGFIQAGAGAVAGTVQGKLREFVSAQDFGAVGNGTTDDFGPLTAFWNSAIANPGVPHRLEKKTYAVSGVLPDINVSNVIITGWGSDIHDVVSLMTGTVIKWIGAAGTVGPFVKITAVSGASNQRISNVVFDGIGIDCNSGAIDYGIEVLSAMECDINVAVCNARITGVQLGVVATLGEAKDLQNNRIHIQGRQIEAPTGLGLVCNGDSSSNVSLNEIWCDIQHKNTTAIFCTNSDNNDWRFVRAFRVAGGTATESVALLGGASTLTRARAERFHYLTTTVPLRAYGTASYAFESINHKIYCLDSENGTPDPTVDAGASVYWRKDITALEDTAWVSFTPVISASSGTITTSAATGQYAKRGKVIHFAMQITITTNGTGAGTLQATVPFAAVFAGAFTGTERAITGRQLNVFLDATTSMLLIRFYDATYPGANGAVMNISGTYSVA